MLLIVQYDQVILIFLWKRFPLEEFTILQSLFIQEQLSQILLQCVIHTFDCLHKNCSICMLQLRQWYATHWFHFVFSRFCFCFILSFFLPYECQSSIEWETNHARKLIRASLVLGEKNELLWINICWSYLIVKQIFVWHICSRGTSDPFWSIVFDNTLHWITVKKTKSHCKSAKE